MPRAASLLLLVFLAACGDEEATTCDTGDLEADADGDSFTIADGDCDDCDDSVYPGAPEESDTDGWDQSCDGPGE